MEVKVDLDINHAKIALEMATGESWEDKLDEEVVVGVMKYIACYGIKLNEINKDPAAKELKIAEEFANAFGKARADEEDSKDEAFIKGVHAANVIVAERFIQESMGQDFSLKDTCNELEDAKKTVKELLEHGGYDSMIPYFMEALYGLITDGNKLISVITELYAMFDDDLSAEHFNLFVSMPEREILEAYVEIQEEINGDIVCRLDEDGDPLIEEDLVLEGEYEEIFNGNCKDFLKSFNKNPRYTRVCCESLDNEDEFELLDFIFF